MTDKQSNIDDFGSKGEQNDERDTSTDRAMTSDDTDSSDVDSRVEQSGESDNDAEGEDSNSIVDDALDGQASDSSQNVQANDPEQYNLPHSLAREWIAKRHGPRWCDSTIATYQSHVRIFLSYLEEKKTTLLNATFDDLLSYIEFRVTIGSAKGTIGIFRSVLKDLYRYIQVRTDADANIKPAQFDEINLNSYNFEGGFSRGAIEIGEVNRLFECFECDRNRLMAYFAVVTAVRNSDIRELRVKDVDYDELEIFIPNPKNGESYTVPMSNELASKLKQWEESGREQYATAESSSYIFPSKLGEKLEDNESFSDPVVEAAKRAGIQEIIGKEVILNSEHLREPTQRKIYRVTPHTLRHTCLTILKMAGAPPEARKKLANHANIETTEDYTHDDDDDWKDLIRDLLDF